MSINSTHLDTALGVDLKNVEWVSDSVTHHPQHKEDTKEYKELEEDGLAIA